MSLYKMKCSYFTYYMHHYLLKLNELQDKMLGAYAAPLRHQLKELKNSTTEQKLLASHPPKS